MAPFAPRRRLWRSTRSALVVLLVPCAGGREVAAPPRQVDGADASAHSDLVPCSEQVPIPGSENWFFGPHGIFACSATGTVLCNGGRFCCCPLRYLWNSDEKGCVTCKVSADLALGEEPSYSKAVLSVTPSFRTNVTCVAVPDGEKLEHRAEVERTKLRSVFDNCLPADGCKLKLQGLAPATTYRVWCLIDAGGVEDLSPPGGLLVATHAVPLRWSSDDSETKYDEIRVSVLPHLACDVVCMVTDVDSRVETEHHDRQYCEVEGCNLTIGNLLPNHPYELRCGSSLGNARLLAPRFVYTKSAPIQFLGVEALSSESLAIQLRPSASTQVLCAAFKSDDGSDEEPSNASNAGNASNTTFEHDLIIVHKSTDQEVKVDMIIHAAFQQEEYCGDTKEGCRLTMSSLQPGTTYLVSCMPSGALDRDVTPLGGAPATTWVRLPPWRRQREWIAALSVGLYLIVASIILAMMIGSGHWEQNNAFSGARGLPVSPRSKLKVQWWPACFGFGCCSSISFEIFRAIGILHLAGIVLYFTLVLPIYAAFAYRRDWV